MINQVSSSTLKHLNSSQVGRTDLTGTPAPKNQAEQNTSFSPESSLRVVNDKVIDAVDKELAKNNAKPIRELDAKNFTPEAVATGILKFVQHAISRAKSRGESTDHLLEQAKAGIDSGFKQAKNILTGLNALSGQIAEGVQQTYSLIQHGLQKLETAQSNGTTVNFDAEISSINQQTKTNTQSFELNIKTQDGDDIKVSISQNNSLHEYSAKLTKSDANTTVNASVTQIESRSSNNIRLTISGNLDKTEVKAIEDLLAEVKAVSESFFEGDVSAAFEAGLSLGFNTQEIASFALDLNENYTQTASRAYREVNSFGTEDNRISPAQLENLLKPAHDFTTALSHDIERVNNSELLKNSSSNPVEGLFNYFSRTKPENAQQIQTLESLTGGSFENITQQILSTVS